MITIYKYDKLTSVKISQVTLWFYNATNRSKSIPGLKTTQSGRGNIQTLSEGKTS